MPAVAALESREASSGRMSVVENKSIVRRMDSEPVKLQGASAIVFNGG